MEGTSRMGLMDDKYEPENSHFMMRDVDDGFDDSRSGSDNFDIADDLDGTPSAATNPKSSKRKKYHRHTPIQIQELESFFQSCPHPDEKQRLELGKKLRLESRQVKFWFQNRRTQLKTKLERHENALLKQEYDKLRMENLAIKEYVGKPLCKGCGGAALIGEISIDERQLRMENARLKEELERVCGIAEKFLGKPISDITSSFSHPQMINSHIDLLAGRNEHEFAGLGFGGSNLIGGIGARLQNGFGMASSSSSSPGLLCSEYEKSMYLQVAVAAMEELIILSHMDSPFWLRSLDGAKETLNHEEYGKKFNPGGVNPPGFTSEATRATGSVIISSLELVNTLMNPRSWVEMFPCMIGKASTIEVLSSGIGGTCDGELLMIDAEFVFPSPLVPLRHIRFIRYCKQHSEGTWAVVDVSVDPLREGCADVSRRCRRLPSGCIVQDVTNGYSLVTCVEHAEYDESAVHSMFRPLVQSGLAFGAGRWLATLQRRTECLAFLATSDIMPESSIGMTREGRKSVLKLTRRVIDNFCAGVCASSVVKWDKLEVSSMAPNLQVMTRVSKNEPGELSGIILSFATSVWMPVSRLQLFSFLHDEQLRGHWDILANDGPMQEMVRIAKSTDSSNSIGILCPPHSADNRESNMVVVQETWSDKASSAVVYAPVDVATITAVTEGGDSDSVKLLPSGFVITDSADHAAPSSSSLLTLGFQIIMDSVPTAKLTVESIETVNGLMNRTIQKIKAAMQCE